MTLPTTAQVLELVARYVESRDRLHKAGRAQEATTLANSPQLLQFQLDNLNTSHLRVLATIEAECDVVSLGELKSAAHNLRYCPENDRRKHLNELDALIGRMERRDG